MDARLNADWSETLALTRHWLPPFPPVTGGAACGVRAEQVDALSDVVAVLSAGERLGGVPPQAHGQGAGVILTM